MNLVLSAILIVLGTSLIVGAARMERCSGKWRGISMVIGLATFVWGLLSTNMALRDQTPMLAATVFGSAAMGVVIGMIYGHMTKTHLRG